MPGDYALLDPAPIPTAVVNKAGPRLAMICFIVLAITPVAFVLGSDLFQKQTDKFGITAVGFALALPLAFVALRCRKLGRITITPTQLSYPKILGERVLQWGDIELIEFGAIRGEAVALPRIVIRMKDGNGRTPAGFTSGGDPVSLQQNFRDLQRALTAYAD